MYIYNRISRFQGRESATTSPLHRYLPANHKNGYKIKQRKANNDIKIKSVGVSRPKSSARSKKIKPLTKKNIEFLTELGYKLIN